MSSPLFVPYIALLVLDEAGMTLRCTNPIPDISNEEIIGIGNFYSPVVSASSPHLEIYGPLPIPHHEKYHLLIVTFRKNDSLVHDPRTKDKNVLSFCQLLIFYKKECDEKVKFGHSQIFTTVDIFLQEFQDVAEVRDEELLKLSEVLIENVILDDQIKSKSIEDIVRDIASRFNTIQQISHLLNRRTKIGIISSDTLSYNLIIQSLFHFQNIDFIYQLDRNEFITRIDTYFMRIVLTLLFDLEMIEGIDFFREMDYYVYIASCEEEGSCQKHIDNIDTMFKQDSNAKIFLVTKERAEQLSLEKKKYLFQESENRKNLKLMISVGDVFRTLDNAIYLILSDILELRKIILSQNKG